MGSMIGAEEVPFIKFRGRRVFLEKTDEEGMEGLKGEEKCKKQCFAFSLLMREILSGLQPPSGLIIVPDANIRI